MSEQDESPPPGDEERRRAIRLTFAYDGDSVRLISRRRVTKAVPPSDEPEGAAAEQGSWAEVRDAGGAILHRLVLHDLVRGDAEVFPEELGEAITRAPVETPSGVFTVLVPDLDRADHLALVSTGPAGAPGLEARAAAAELIRVPLGTAEDTAPQGDQPGSAP